MKKRVKDLEKELSRARLEEVKIMWEHANWEWRLIFILGIIALIYIASKVGMYLGNLIG